ncbi:hypothetical protein [Rugosimonospora africana]|uniref:Uncharacterized protein n=1 Tax=Rugosimonospora africana TaxID=556532 RepID=A0A8J3R1P9_9ACTN|nr:hypothetical protein [Rugosimonospora africana]GIH21375.1 hypothetical protein Raf01_95470 [Rugosimonospora africana]
MSDFFINHPIPPATLRDFLSVSLAVSVVLVVIAVIEMARIPVPVWPAANVSRRRWLTRCGIGVPLVPLGLVVAALWAIRILPRLDAHIYPPRRGSWLFRPATTRTDKAERVVIFVLAMLEFGTLLHGFGNWTIGDPGTVYISNLNHDIKPRTYIAAQCPGSVRRALHLVSDEMRLDGHDYQQWSVDPVPGHLNEVLLDTDTGQILCP